MTSQVNSDYGNRNRFLTAAVPIGAALTASDIAWYALEKENRADTFVNTAKKCSKAFTKDTKKGVSWILNKCKWEKGAEFINKLSNKKMFAGALGAGILINAAFLHAISKLFDRH